MPELREKILDFLDGGEHTTVGHKSRQESLTEDDAALPQMPEKVAARPTSVEVDEPILPVASPSTNPFTKVADEIRSRAATSENAAVSKAANDYGVDSRGIPWDERIHAVTQGRVKDGSWRYKRGVEDSTIKAIEKELKGVATNHTSTAPSIPTAVHAPIIAAPPIPLHNIQPVAVPVITPPMPLPQPVPSAHTFATFKATLIPTLAKLVKDGKLTQDYVNQLCAHYGVDLIFKVNDQQLEEIFNGFVQYGMITKAQ